MTQRMIMAREAFKAKAGERVMVHAGTYTWDSLPNGQREFAFEISLDGARPCLHVIALAGRPTLWMPPQIGARGFAQPFPCFPA